MTDRDGHRRPTVNDGEGNKNPELKDNETLPTSGLLVDRYGRRIKSMRIMKRSRASPVLPSTWG